MREGSLPERYVDLSEIGSGGMGAVYRARDTVLDRLVAVKVLVGGSAGWQDIRRFQREATAAARLSHDNLVKILDFGIGNDTSPYLVMEYVEGPTLKQLIGKNGPLAPGAALELMAQVARGLAHAHRHGVIHRDMKSANIVVTESDDGSSLARVIDFGIARLEGANEKDKKLTCTNAIVGSPFYMSPEQVRGEPADERSDIYSLGCVLFESLTGRTPFRGENPMETMQMHIEEPPPSLGGAVDPGMPASLEELVARALAKKPCDRYQTMDDFLDSIERALDNESFCQLDVSDGLVEPGGTGISSISRSFIWAAFPAVVIIGAGIACYQVLKPGREVARLPASVPAPPGRPKEVNAAMEHDSYSIGRSRDADFLEIVISTDRTLDWDRIDALAEDRPFVLELKESRISSGDCLRIASHPKIYGVRLIECTISNDILKCLTNSGRLQKLSLYGSSGFTEAGLVHLQEMKSLVELNLGKTELTDDCSQYIIPLVNLIRLDLRKNDRITDRSIRSICSELHDLQFLQLSFTGISDEVMPAIASLGQLKELMVGRTRISDVGIEKLTNKKLERVSLVETGVTAEGVERLSGLESMEIIWVSPSLLSEGIRSKGKCQIKASGK